MQQLGRYQILSEIGRGGFATVYRGLDTELDREARALAALRHPHILMVFEVTEADGRLFIVMELAHGPSLAKRIEDGGRLTWGEVLAAARPVCEALDYA